MIELHLNERKVAEQAIQSGTYRDKTKDILSLLARYYYHIMQIHRKKQIFEFIDMWMQRYYKNYNVNEWSDLINLYIDNAKKYPLTQIDCVPVTEAEMKSIQSVEGDKQRRLAFTALVLAKYGNLRNEKNNGWIMVESYQLFKRAEIHESVENSYLLLHDLCKAGLIEWSKRVDNINFQVRYIQDDSNVVMNVTDLRELGLQYMNYAYGGYGYCRECGKMFKMTMNNHKYCRDCAYVVEYHKPMLTQTITCCDCGEEFEVSSKSHKAVRCPECYEEYRKCQVKKNVRKYRSKNTM